MILYYYYVIAATRSSLPTTWPGCTLPQLWSTTTSTSASCSSPATATSSWPTCQRWFQAKDGNMKYSHITQQYVFTGGVQICDITDRGGHPGHRPRHLLQEPGGRLRPPLQRQRQLVQVITQYFVHMTSWPQYSPLIVTSPWYSPPFGHMTSTLGCC